MRDPVAHAGQQDRISRETADGAAHGRSRALIAIAAFLASAAFVLWRNTEVGVLVDISYVLNTATRIALGDVPYVQFPLAQAPGEFLMQAVLIKVFGAQYGVQIAYASILGGGATAIAYLVATRIMKGIVPSPDAAAALLAIPLVPLGIYAIYPHPFYDADACLLVLACVGATYVALDRRSRRAAVLAGTLLAIPIFVKQNIGGAFLVLMLASLALHAWRRPDARPLVRWVAGAAAVTLALEVVALQILVGVDHYLAWTWTFALAGRGVTYDRVATFLPPVLVAVALAPLLRRTQRERRVAIYAAAFGIVLIAYVALPVPLLFAPGFIPPLLVFGCVLAAERMGDEGPVFALCLPFVIVGTTLGVLQSQGLGASSFAVFPLLMLAIACAARDATALLATRVGAVSRALGAVALALVVSGSLYTLSDARLFFIDVDAPGPVMRSTFPTLAGLAARGPYIAELDAVLVWTRDHVPADEGIVFLPGEDPVFFALQRKPLLPSVYFYDIATPYTPAETARIADERGLRWVVVKDRLQLTEVPPLERPLVEALTAHATLVTSVGPYRVFRR